MNIGQVGQGALRQPSDEGQSLQRRLLQDLERQWLDSWQVAGQSQDIAPESAPREEAAQTLGGEAVSPANPVSTPGTSAATPALQEAGRGWQRQTSRAVDVKGNGARFMDKTSANRSQTSSVPAASPTLPSAPKTESAEPTVDAGDPSQAGGPGAERESGIALPAAVDAPAAGTFVAPQRPPAMPTTGTPASDSPALQTTSQTEAVGHDVAAVRLTLHSLNSSAASSVPAPAEPQSDADEAPQSQPTKRHPQAPAEPVVDSGSRQLMLRELSETEVLASMRDANFTQDQSQLAAQGLARALMEAGYARVQVVVNGQQPVLGTRSPTGTRAAEAASPSPQDATPQESRHGH